MKTYVLLIGLLPLLLSGNASAQLSICNLEGMHHVITNGLGLWGGGTTPCNSIWEGIVEFERVGTSDSYRVYTFLDGTRFLDMSFGAYYVCYDVTVQDELPNGNLQFENQGGTYAITGASQWGEVYVIETAEIDGATFALDIQNDYGEQFSTVIMPMNGVLWEALCVFNADEDGFFSDEDCNDSNPDIYPGAPEIPDNSIDEDCDGEDGTTSSIVTLDGELLHVFPNPAHDILSISYGNGTQLLIITLFAIDGQFIVQSRVNRLDVSELNSGIYILMAEHPLTGNRTLVKVVRQ